MTENEVFSKVKDLVVEKLSIDPAKITMDANFRKDLGADSLDTYELVYAIEEELGDEAVYEGLKAFKKYRFEK